MLLALILGVVLLVVGENVAQPLPLNQLEIIFGWVAIVIAIILLILTLVGHRPYNSSRWYL